MRFTSLILAATASLMTVSSASPVDIIDDLAVRASGTDLESRADGVVCQTGKDSKFDAYVDGARQLVAGLRRDPDNKWFVCGTRAEKMVFTYSKIFIQATNRNEPNDKCESSAYRDIATAVESIIGKCSDSSGYAVRGYAPAYGNGDLMVFVGRN